MPPSTLLPINSPPDPWSRMLRLVAAMTLFYSAAHVARFIPTAILIIQEFPRVSWMPNTATEFWYWAITLQQLLVIAGALVVGAAILWRTSSYHLLACGLWTLLILWSVNELSTWFLLIRRHRPYDMIIYPFLHEAEVYIFPVLVIFVLRAHRLRYVYAGAGEEYPSPWPRLPRVIAMFTIIFGLIVAVRTAYFVHWLFITPVGLAGAQNSLHETSQQWRLASGVSLGVVGLFMCTAGARLWRDRRSHRLLILSAMIWLGFRLAVVVNEGYYMRQRLHVNFYAAQDFLSNIAPTVFPLMIILMLKDYSKSLTQPSNFAPAVWAIPQPGHTLPPPSH